MSISAFVARPFVSAHKTTAIPGPIGDHGFGLIRLSLSLSQPRTMHNSVFTLRRSLSPAKLSLLAKQAVLEALLPAVPLVLEALLPVVAPVLPVLVVLSVPAQDLVFLHKP